MSEWLNGNRQATPVLGTLIGFVVFKVDDIAVELQAWRKERSDWSMRGVVLQAWLQALESGWW